MVPRPDHEHSAVVPELYNFPEWRKRDFHLPDFAKELIAGGTAGGLGKSLVAPLERVKILFQTGNLERRGVCQTLKRIYRHEGVPGLFKGNGASVLRIVPYAAIHFAAFERYRVAIRLARGLDTHDLESQPLPVEDLFAGSAAGATAVIFTYPMDLIRTRLAYSSDYRPSAGGPQSPRGTTMPALSSPVPRLSPTASLGSGTGSSSDSGSNRPRSGTSNPSDRIPDSKNSDLQRQQVGGQQRRQRAKIPRMMMGILQRDGAGGLYRGLGPTIVGVLPYAGLKFYVYQCCKQHWRATAGRGPSERVPVVCMLMFGALAGLIAQTATYPLDVVRRRMQVQDLKEVDGTVHLRSTWHGLRTVAASGGVRALFAGLSINYVKVVPATAIGFTLYDSLKQLLGLRTS